jgi:hypothetical protein
MLFAAFMSLIAGFFLLCSVIFTLMALIGTSPFCNKYRHPLAGLGAVCLPVSIGLFLLLLKG